MEIRIKLLEILEKRNISQRKFSRLTGIRLPSINEMCQNETKRLPLENLAVICEVLNVRIEDVLELVDKKE